MFFAKQMKAMQSNADLCEFHQDRTKQSEGTLMLVQAMRFDAPQCKGMQSKTKQHRQYKTHQNMSSNRIVFAEDAR